jgi:anti-sigma factor ChrR (cupin superfamily)
MMAKKPTKAAAKVIAKVQRLLDDFARFDAEHPGAFDEIMARVTQNRKKAAAASAKVRTKKAKKRAPGHEVE